MTTINKLWFFSIIVMWMFITTISGCKKEEEENNQQNTVKDIEGNIYKIVTIGNQVWFSENLRTTKYNDGTSIPTNHTEEEWGNLSTGAYAVNPHEFIEGLNSDVEVLKAYGALYNYYAIEDLRGLCPSGWHIPSDEDWTTLMIFAGGESIAGYRLKSTRIISDDHPRWETQNAVGTDDYGFSALPGGNRHIQGGYLIVGGIGNWYSSDTDAGCAYGWSVSSLNNYLYHDCFDKRVGLSVRCVKNN